MFKCCHVPNLLLRRSYTKKLYILNVFIHTKCIVMLYSVMLLYTDVSTFNEAITIALALAHTLPSSFCQRHQSRWQISNLSWMALAGRVTNARLIMVGGTIINGKYKHISTAFAACQQVMRFQVSKCDCICTCKLAHLLHVLLMTIIMWNDWTQ